MKRALLVCWLVACGGEAAKGGPAPVASRAEPTDPAASASPESVQGGSCRSDLDDPSLVAYCVEATKIPMRGAFDADPFFGVDGSIDLTAVVTTRQLELSFRWPSQLVVEPSGTRERRERASSVRLALTSDLAPGAVTATLTAISSSSWGCSHCAGKMGSASGTGQNEPTAITVTNLTSAEIEGVVEVTDATGSKRLAFRAPIVAPAVPAARDNICCLRE